MAETRSMLLNEAVVRETEEVLGRLEQAIAEQNQKLDESFAKLIGAIRLISDNVNDVSSCGHLQQKRSSPVASMTPDHYLQHKNSGICMIDNDEEDRFLSDSAFVEIEIEKDLVEIDVEMSSDDAQFLDAGDSVIEHNQLIHDQDENHSTDSFQKNTLFCNQELGYVLQDLTSAIVEKNRYYGIDSAALQSGNVFKVSEGDKSCEKSTVLNIKFDACHLFDKMLLRKFKSQQRRKLSLSPKSWKFKYKEVKVLRRLPQNEHDNLRGGMIIKKLHEMSNVDSGFNQKTRIELEVYGWSYKKPINPDQIRLKSMCEVAELQGIESRAFNKRIRELLFGYYGFKVQLLPDFKKRCVVIVGKKAPNVDITATNKQLEYSREGRWEKEDEFEQVVNHTPFSVEKLVRLRDRDAVLIKQFLLSDEKFHLKHKWRSKFLHSISELVLCFDSVELSISYANSGDYLLKRGSSTGSSTVHYEYSMWKQNDQWTKLFGSRRLVIHTVGREKTVEEMYQRVDQLVNMKLANVGKMLAVTQSQTFDPGIRLEAKETLRSYVPSRAAAMVLMVRTHESMEETTWEFSLFCSDNFQTLNLVAKVLQTREI